MARDLNDRAGCGPRSRTRDRPSPSSRYRSARRSARRRTARSARSSPITTARQRLVAQRHHHPKPRPRQPRAEQHRPRSRRPGPVAIVPLHPQPRLRDPRPGPPPVLAAATGAWPQRPPAASCATTPDSPSRPASHAPTSARIQRARAIDQLLDLRRERVHQRPAAAPARGSPPPAASRAATQPARPSCDHTPPAPPLPAATRSGHTPPGSPSLPPVSSRPASSDRASTANARPSTGASGQNRGEKPWPPMGRNSGHQRGDSMAAYGELSMATVTKRRRPLDLGA